MKTEKKDKSKYYKFSNENVGIRYFKVNQSEYVLQVISHTQKKKGRPFQKGVNLIRYSSFIGSWGWKLDNSKFIKEITKDEFEKQLNKMIKSFNKF